MYRKQSKTVNSLWLMIDSSDLKAQETKAIRRNVDKMDAVQKRMKISTILDNFDNRNFK